ncbi:phosphonate ABC transporter ATP-binding protein [Ammoniphilus sp. CFH 90114]|uniref:phosphonate ABC transporter ATP-binding protein n=1 Tax=Ammoniphilus sp. CFH 90114 TaxID=2493665 RepID=UPI00100F0E3E|nr:phosphonate ABC transporter ATP-binding protein [Ammoniphilus sp. CFH 90114]RXT14936.1 phosphonate ABC transporter ATP-binding protein [Ammoniphilus sp. CFH 90114]
MLVEIENLKVQYHRATSPALESISFGVGEGEFVVVLGLSGAGKSTLIRCINQLVKPTSGTIRWEGKEITGYKGRALTLYRRSIGMIFQSFNLLGRLSAVTNVLVGRLGYISRWRALTYLFPSIDLKIAEDALDRVGLAGVKHQRADQLSGGQRQRVAIARALVQRPKLILGDEPVASLDPLTSRSIMDLLKSINKEENITMIINLHDVELAKQYATRVIGISHGRIVFDDIPERLDGPSLEKIYT